MNYQSIKKVWEKRRAEINHLFHVEKLSGPVLAKRYKLSLQRIYQIVGKRKKDP